MVKQLIKKFLSKVCASEKAQVEINTKATIIVGNQKTGSSAICNLLSLVSGKTLSQDFLYQLDPSGQQLLFDRGMSLSEFIRIHPSFFSHDIIKELDLIFVIDQVFDCFPVGKYVCIIRDPRDNIRSILNRLCLPGHLPTLSKKDLDMLPNSEWRAIIEGTRYGHAGNNYIETLANRWRSIICEYEKYRNRMILVRYEDFLKDKAAFILQLSAQLGMTPVKDIRDSLNVQYQPKGNSNIKWIDFFGDDNLSIIERICRDKMFSYQYTPLK